MVDPEELSKAQKLIEEGKILRLQDRTVSLVDHFQVIGTNKEKYLTILPNFCTCMHFQISCIKEPNSICKHILACRIIGDNIKILEVDDWQALIFDDYLEIDN